MLDFLRQLGLNKYEAEAYLALLSLGISGAFIISKESGVPFGRIYDSLNTLEMKGFVEVVPSKPKKYKAVNPEFAIKGFIDERFNNLEKLRGLIKDKVNHLFLKKESNDVVSVNSGKVNFAKCVSEHFNFRSKLWATSEGFNLEKSYPALGRYSGNKMVNEFLLVDESKADFSRLSELKKKGLRFKHFPLENVRFLVSDEELVTISLQEKGVEWTNIHIKSRVLGKALTKLLKTVWDSV